MLRNDFIKRKISLIQEDLSPLSSLAHHTMDEIVSDVVKQAAVERFLERIINRAVDINQHIIKELAQEKTSPPKDYRETFLRLAELEVYPQTFAEEIGKSIGTRNVLTHEYDVIDHTLIYDSMADCLRDYQKYIEYLLEFLKKQS